MNLGIGVGAENTRTRRSHFKSILTPSVPKKAEDGSHCLGEGCRLRFPHGLDASKGHHCLNLIDLTPESPPVWGTNARTRAQAAAGSGKRHGSGNDLSQPRAGMLGSGRKTVRFRRNPGADGAGRFFCVPALPVEVPPSASSPPHHVPSRRGLACKDCKGIMRRTVQSRSGRSDWAS